jgi:predicted DNA-binding transcriptional regulator AlpA
MSLTQSMLGDAIDSALPKIPTFDAPKVSSSNPFTAPRPAVTNASHQSDSIYLTVKDCASILGVSVKTIRRRIDDPASGFPHPVRQHPKGWQYILRSEFDAYLANQLAKRKR